MFPKRCTFYNCAKKIISSIWGSIAGKEVYERRNVYCAGNFAVDVIHKAMRIDLLKHNVNVTGIHP